MLNLSQIKELLQINAELIAKEAAKQGAANFRRLMDLQMQRICLKDCLIDALEDEKRQNKRIA